MFWNKGKVCKRATGLTIERRPKNAQRGSHGNEIKYMNIQSPHSTEYNSFPTAGTIEKSSCV